FPVANGTVCSAVTGTCQVPRCDGSGNCIAVPNPQLVGKPCPNGQSFGQCLPGYCFADGHCAAKNPVKATPCTLPNVPVCQQAACNANGTCVYASASEGQGCPRDINDNNLCHEYVCHSGSCISQSTPFNSSCDDGDSCDLDLCNGNGLCTHT